MLKKRLTGIALSVMLLMPGISLAEPPQGKVEYVEQVEGADHRLPVMPSPHNKAYEKSCGSCHMAYQPGFLPLRSWQRLLGGLDAHFGTSVTLSVLDFRRIDKLMRARATDKTHRIISKAILKSIPAKSTPLRITGIGYFQKEHSAVKWSKYANEPKNRLAPRCQICHREASQGYFDKEGLIPPGQPADRSE